MKKKIITMGMTLVLLLSMVCLAKKAAVLTLSSKESDQTVVVIDAGHGGDDPGKVGMNGTLEKDVNLAVACYVKEYLEKNDLTVVMTRQEDEGLYQKDSHNKKIEDLKNRMALIDSSKPTLTVSVHQNSYSSEAVCGPQVFYYATSEKAKLAAGIMQTQLNEGLSEGNGRAPKGNTSYYLLKKSSVPTIIVECGFLSNQREADLLATEEYQKQVAWNIAMGVLKCVNAFNREGNVLY